MYIYIYKCVNIYIYIYLFILTFYLILFLAISDIYCASISGLLSNISSGPGALPLRPELGRSQPFMFTEPTS